MNPMAAVVLAWESQSTRRVGCSAAARQAAKFTAVVVFPTPPFWFATAIIRAKRTPESENLAKLASGCKLFHVEQSLTTEYCVPRDWFLNFHPLGFQRGQSFQAVPRETGFSLTRRLTRIPRGTLGLRRKLVCSSAKKSTVEAGKRQKTVAEGAFWR